MTEQTIQTSEQPPRGKSFARAIGVIALICLTLATFGIVLGSRQFLNTDEAHILHEINSQSLEGLRIIWLEPGAFVQYMPLADTSFWIEVQIFGHVVAGYHLDSILIHAVAAALLWVILRRLKVPGAWLAAAIFAVHPVQAETVSWLGGRGIVLGGMFYFAAGLVYLRYCGLTPNTSEPLRPLRPDGQPQPPPRIELHLPQDPLRQYGLVIALFLAALASNTATATLPVALLLVIWWKRSRPLAWHDVTPLFPMLGLGAIGLAITYHLAPAASWTDPSINAAGGPAWAARILLPGRVIAFSFGKLLVPIGLNFDYPALPLNVQDPAQWLCPLAVLFVLVALWALRRRLGRGPLAAALFYLVALAPMLANHLPWGASVVADRYQYLACVGPIALIVAALTLGLGRAVAGGWLAPQGRGLLGAAVVVFLGVVTLQRTSLFREDQTLWWDVWQKNHLSFLAAEQLGEFYRGKGEIESRADKRAEFLNAAIGWYREAQKLHRNDSSAMLDQGLVTDELGRPDEALKLYKQAIAAFPNNAEAHLALGTAYYNRRDFKGAEDEFRTSIGLAPNSYQAHSKLGGLLARTAGKDPARLQEAYDELNTARILNPDDIPTLNELVAVALRLGNADLATSVMADIERLDPTNVPMRINFAAMLASSGQVDRAQRVLLLVLRDDPDSADAQQNLGIVDMRLGKWRYAAQHLAKAMELDKSRTTLAGPLAQATRRAATQPATTEPEAMPVALPQTEK
jgi:tetratricopeptide (TPR) repeat protein